MADMQIRSLPEVRGRRKALRALASLTVLGGAPTACLTTAAASAAAAPAGAAPAAGTAGSAAASGSVAPAGAPVLLVIGDSMSAEYGLKRGAGWVALLARRVGDDARTKGPARPYQVVNASISGETTAGGRSRIDELLARHRPRVVVIELGGNDALRGLDLAMTERNLREMTQRAQRAGARVLLVGIQVPPNYGRAYTERFSAMFEGVSRGEKAALVPFLLDGFADRMEFFQADRIHPNERAQAQMLETVWPALNRLL